MNNNNEAEGGGGGVDMVIMGAGIDLSLRLEIIKTIFEKSDKTSVHMKDRASGKAGFPACTSNFRKFGR